VPKNFENQKKGCPNWRMIKYSQIAKLPSRLRPLDISRDKKIPVKGRPCAKPKCQIIEGQSVKKIYA